MSRDEQRETRDLIENRTGLNAATKLHLLYLSVRENGVSWTSALAAYYLASTMSERVFQYLQRAKLAKGLPGTSSPRMNEVLWTAWDWSAAGEEWTRSDAWKQSLISCILARHIPQGAEVLEIGPGAGRWTEALLARAKRLIAVDISETCIELCRRKFAASVNATFLKTSGCELGSVANRSIDALWSFDVFVHINCREAAEYVREFARTMRPGAVGVVHHGSGSGSHGGRRSDLTTADFTRLLTEHGFEISDQFDRWTEGDRSHTVGLYQDVITVFRLP
ncbi:MAG: class I SAM-dependent methyltransferase [Stellaceae bacterium]